MTIRADSLWRPDPAITYEPPRNTVLEVLYGGKQHNETPVGMFPTRPIKSAVTAKAAKQAKKQTGLHHFTDVKGRPNNLSGVRTGGHNLRGPIYEKIKDTLRKHPDGLTYPELRDLLGDGSRIGANRISQSLSSMKKTGEVVHGGPLGRWGVPRG